MDQIFNELSANGSYADKYAASAGMERMLRLSLALNRCGFSRSLRLIEGAGQLQLSSDYTLSEWSNDRSAGANRDLQRLFLTSASRAPYVEQFIADAEQDCLIEFKFQGQSAMGPGLAHLWGIPVLSLDGDSLFTTPSFAIEYQQICADNETSETVNVISVTHADQIDPICQSLQSSQIAGITDGRKLVASLPDLFPNLVCSSNAASQMMELTGSEQFFQEVIRHLSILNATMGKWDGGIFEPLGLTWSPESGLTLSQFGKTREFVCADGICRQFSLHTKMKSANQRIYFYPEPEKRRVHIGYVGKHLPTTNFRT